MHAFIHSFLIIHQYTQYTMRGVVPCVDNSFSEYNVTKNGENQVDKMAQLVEVLSIMLIV